jgi:hypothetical protein
VDRLGLQPVGVGHDQRQVVAAPRDLPVDQQVALGLLDSASRLVDHVGMDGRVAHVPAGVRLDDAQGEHAGSPPSLAAGRARGMNPQDGWRPSDPCRHCLPWQMRRKASVAFCGLGL